MALHSVSDTVTENVVAYYERAVVNGEMVHSSSYCKELKRNSYTVKVTDGSYFQIVRFVVCDIGCGANCYALGRYLRPAPYHFCGSKDALKLRHITPVHKMPSALTAVPASDIVGKCVFVSSDVLSVNFVCDQIHSHDSSTVSLNT